MCNFLKFCVYCVYTYFYMRFVVLQWSTSPVLRKRKTKPKHNKKTDAIASQGSLWYLNTCAFFNPRDPFRNGSHGIEQGTGCRRPLCALRHTLVWHANWILLASYHSLFWICRWLQLSCLSMSLLSKRFAPSLIFIVRNIPSYWARHWPSHMDIWILQAGPWYV